MVESRDISETAWRRGYKDTATAAKSLWFWAIELTGGAVMGYLTQDPLAFAYFVIAVLVAFWLGATYSAPIRQRNEARQTVLALVEQKTLADRLEEMAKEIRGFSRDFRLSQPSPRHNLNYITQSLKPHVKFEGPPDAFHGNMFFGPGDNIEQIQMWQNAIDEKRNHEARHIDLFHNQFGGALLSRLGKASLMGAVTEEELKQVKSIMEREEFGNAAPFFEKIADICAKTAANLRELDSLAKENTKRHA